jgi:hypothetical protein
MTRGARSNSGGSHTIANAHIPAWAT